MIQMLKKAKLQNHIFSEKAHPLALGGTIATQPDFSLMTESFDWGVVVRILLIALATYFLVTFVSFLLKRLAARSKRRGEFIQKTIPFAGYTLWLMAILYMLSGMLRQPSFLLTAVVGFMLIAALLASHSVLRDVAAGLIILFERTFRLGKTIRIGKVQGVVEHIGLRSFHVRTGDGALVILPNSEAIRQSVKITNPDAPEVMIQVDVPFPQALPLEAAKEIVREAAAVSPYICIRQPIEVIFKNEVRGPHMQVSAFVFDVRYANALKSDILEACRKAFGHAVQAEMQDEYEEEEK